MKGASRYNKITMLPLFSILLKIQKTNFIGLLFCLFLFFPTLIFAINNSDKKKIITPSLKSLHFLIKNDYRVYGKKGKSLYWLGGNWIKKVPEEHMYGHHLETSELKINKKELLQMLYSVYLKNHKIFFSKKGHVYQIMNNKVTQIYPLKDLDDIWYKNQKKIKRKEVLFKNKLDLIHCSFCQLQISGNFVTLDAKNPQLSPEINWLPYYRISANWAVGFPIGVSSYLIENSELKSSFDLGLKFQILPRYYIGQTFFEVGLGLHKFTSYTETNSVSTIGIGRIFEHDLWIINEKIAFNFLYLHLSNIEWKKTVREVKLGVGISI